MDSESLESTLLCTISLERMNDPVVLFPSGNSYERAEIRKSLLAIPDMDPKSGMKFDEKLRYAPNYALRSLLQDKGLYRPCDDGMSEADFQLAYDMSWNDLMSRKNPAAMTTPTETPPPQPPQASSPRPSSTYEQRTRTPHDLRNPFRHGETTHSEVPWQPETENGFPLPSIRGPLQWVMPTDVEDESSSGVYYEGEEDDDDDDVPDISEDDDESRANILLQDSQAVLNFISNAINGPNRDHEVGAVLTMRNDVTGQERYIRIEEVNNEGHGHMDGIQHPVYHFDENGELSIGWIAVIKFEEGWIVVQDFLIGLYRFFCGHQTVLDISFEWKLKTSPAGMLTDFLIMSTMVYLMFLGLCKLVGF